MQAMSVSNDPSHYAIENITALLKLRIKFVKLLLCNSLPVLFWVSPHTRSVD